MASDPREARFRAGLDLPGDFLRRYSLGEPIGSGALGFVYRALDRRSGGAVAVKILAQLEPDLILRFVQEGKILASIRHPHVVAVHEAGSLGLHPYLVMDLVPGGSLRERAATGRLPVVECVRLVRDALAGLSEIHARGVLHRDIKPDNILLSGSGRARLGDLGIAKDTRRPDLNLTRAGTVVGSPRYIAPEILRGEPASVASDLYAMGLILHELVAGRHPFPSRDLFELMRCHEEEIPPSLDTLVPEVTAELASLVAASIAKDPDERPASAADMQVALQYVLEEAGVVLEPVTEVTARESAPGNEAEPPPEPEPASRVWPSLLPVLGILFGCLVALWVGLGR